EMIARLADDGLAVLVISSDLPEVLGVSDRVLVIAEGELVAELDPSAVDQEAVMMAATRNVRDAAHADLEPADARRRREQARSWTARPAIPGERSRRFPGSALRRVRLVAAGVHDARQSQ